MGCTDRESTRKTYKYDEVTEKWYVSSGFVPTFEAPTREHIEEHMVESKLDPRDFDFSQSDSGSWRAIPRGYHIVTSPSGGWYADHREPAVI